MTRLQMNIAEERSVRQVMDMMRKVAFPVMSPKLPSEA